MRLFFMPVFTLLLLCAVPQKGFAEDILCPDASGEKSETPQNIAGVQADIERLNLCVERAKLLKQLDDVIKQRKDVLSKVVQSDVMMPTGGVGGIPPLPVGALPSVRGSQGVQGIDTLRPGEVRINAPAANPLDAAAAPAASSVVAVPTWRIRKIWGQGVTMRAQLTDGSGTLVNVVKADPLPDGAVVESVSVKGVTVSRNGKINDLSWEEMNDSKPSTK